MATLRGYVFFTHTLPHVPLRALMLLLANTHPAIELAARLHPVLVHFPIAFLMLAAGVEVFATLRRRPMSPTTRLLTIVGMFASLAAVGSGLLNAQFEQGPKPSPEVLLHRNIGFIAAGLTIAVGLHAIFVPTKRLIVFRLGLLGAAAAVGLTGHLGGSLTYGPDYLTTPLKRLIGIAPQKSPPLVQTPARIPPAVTTEPNAAPLPAVAIDFNTEILPILEKSCFSCHGPGKRKGGLRLDSRAAMLLGGKNGAAIVPGNAEESALITRVSSTDPDIVMPPEDPPLPPEQIDRLRAWIQSGAAWPS
jgi:uncharacterized membrane protein